MRNTFFILLFLFSTYIVRAQSALYLSDTSVKVYDDGGNEKTLAWCGGFNNPQFAMGDLNNDGLADLVVFEAYKGVRTFINTGTAGSPNYKYQPQYTLNFPPISDYLILADYNCDGIPDLFQQGLTGFAVYTGYYNAAKQLCFTFYKDLYYSNDATTFGPANAFNNPGDIPAIVDVDNDGDLDFISYNVVGGNLNFYKNMRVEKSLPCDSIVIELKDRCWGKVYQAFWRAHELQYDCSEAGLSLHSDDSTKRVMHQGNTPCLFDYDGDGDYDYLDGSISFNEMTFLLNGRIPYDSTGPDSMVYQDTTWQTGGTSIELPIWPAAFNVDIDQDGKKDLLIAPNAQNASENYKCIWYYKNNTIPGHPDWQFQSDTFLVDKSIDAGTAAYPMFFDYNRDGLPDLFVGSDGYTQSSGLLRSRLIYYKNTSKPSVPSFTLQSVNFLNIDSFNFQGAAPAAGDIDNDGKADLILGHSDGSLSYFKNVASSDSAQPIWQLTELQLTDKDGNVINVSGHAAPFIYDIDKDGRPDLVIGSLFGYFQYYRNVSTTPGTISLEFINSELGKAKADPRQNLGCYSTPFIGRIDNSGTDYILSGSNSGNIYRFTGFQSGDTTAIYTMLDTQYSYIDSTYLHYNHGGTEFGIYENLRSTVAVADIAGDGNYEMLVGNIEGGLQLYKNNYTSNLPVISKYEREKCRKKM